MRPLPDDPAAEQVWRLLDIDPGEWLLASAGDYSAAAVETMKDDGSAWQRCIAITVPARRNHSIEHETIRLMVSPEDAKGLAAVILHAALRALLW